MSRLHDVCGRAGTGRSTHAQTLEGGLSQPQDKTLEVALRVPPPLHPRLEDVRRREVGDVFARPIPHAQSKVDEMRAQAPTIIREAGGLGREALEPPRHIEEQLVRANNKQSTLWYAVDGARVIAPQLGACMQADRLKAVRERVRRHVDAAQAMRVDHLCLQRVGDLESCGARVACVVCTALAAHDTRGTQVGRHAQRCQRSRLWPRWLEVGQSHFGEAPAHRNALDMRRSAKAGEGQRRREKVSEGGRRSNKAGKGQIR